MTKLLLQLLGRSNTCPFERDPELDRQIVKLLSAA
jgi:hypothetical protein